MSQNSEETHSEDSQDQDQISDSNQLISNEEQQLLAESNDAELTRKVGKWTSKEDELLQKYVPLFGEKQWRKISEYVPGRTSIQCLHRWTKILKPGLVKGPWTAEEDQKLMTWVKTEGATKWAQCSNFIKGRSGKQCRERWFNNLNPNVKKGNWAKEEDELIFELYQKYGSSWSKIAKFIPGRTENAIKNRFYSTLRKLAADKKKVQDDSPGEKLIQEDLNDSSDILPKDTLESIPGQPPNALYMLLQDKTCTAPQQEDPKKDISTISTKDKNANTSITQNDKTKQSFNINGEKFLVVRDDKITDKNIQEAANKLLNAEMEENDLAFEDFLTSLDNGLKDDFLTMEFESTRKLDDITQLDNLQRKILNYCQTNIRDLADTFKTVAQNKFSKASSEISSSDLRGKPGTPGQPTSKLELNAQQQIPKFKGTTILTPTPSNRKDFPLKNQQLMNKGVGLNLSPSKGPAANAFSPYTSTINNPLLVPPKDSSKNVSENSDKMTDSNLDINKDKKEQNLKIQDINADFPEQGDNIKDLKDHEIAMNAPLTTNSQNSTINNLSDVVQHLPVSDLEDTEKRMTFLFQQLHSLETLLAKTRNDLVQFESTLEQDEKKNENQENLKIEEIPSEMENEKSKQSSKHKSLEKLNSEFEQILKKKKVE